MAYANIEDKRAADRAYRLKNRKKLREQLKKWRAANPDRVVAGRVQYAKKHSEHSRAWYVANREKALARSSTYRKAHLAKYAAHTMKRIAAQMKRTPSWADLGKIETIYAEARTMSAIMDEAWHVDHVIPLQGKLVSGLHVHTNLQILPGIENVRKHNRFQVEFQEETRDLKRAA